MPSNHLILCHPLLFPPSPKSGSFQMSQFFTSGGQSIGASASTLVLPMNIQDWFPLGWTGWISLMSKGLSRVFSNTTVQKHQFFGAQLFVLSSSHINKYMTTGETIALTILIFVNKGPYSQSYGFPVVMYRYKSWTIKKVECQRIDAFELWGWKRLLRVSWTSRRSNQSILKEINPEYSVEALVLKLKL